MTARSNLQNLEAATPSVRLARLPTNTTTRSHSVHRWFNFIAGFSPELVHACVGMEDAKDGATMRLLDPFSGCGTAPLAARQLGCSAVAYEPHPFFAIISEAKANSARYWGDLSLIHAALGRGLLRQDDHGLVISQSAGEFLGKMFREEDLLMLHSARRELNERGLGDNPMAILILSRMLDHCCFAATDGIYKAPTTSKRTISPKAALDKVIAMIIEDERDARLGSGLVHIYESSSEIMDELDTDSVDVVVTSPPYLNNFDFAEMTRMYLYFWGLAGSWGQISERVRSRLIVNTTTALKGHKDRQDIYRNSLPENVRMAADAAVKILSVRRSERAGKKEYDLLVYPYLSQMQKVLRETLRVLKPGAPFHMMVSDAALYGVHLPAPQWLAEIMVEAGFHDVQCEMVRPRGHRWVLDKREGSATGLGEYYVFGRCG
jgi:DNA modification methylase